MIRNVMAVLIIMLMSYILCFLAFAIIFAALEFIPFGGDINEYLLDLKEIAERSFIFSIVVGIRYFLLIFFKF
ncbi:hypothetical protein A2U20_08270 [Glaesserella parasuis D74]|nr:hypothetical protein A2U20_08270 [Glaesserella parasuis D74]